MDARWRPTSPNVLPPWQRPAPPRRNWRLAKIILALLALNAAVILYHGDPRHKQPPPVAPPLPPAVTSPSEPPRLGSAVPESSVPPFIDLSMGPPLSGWEGQATPPVLQRLARTLLKPGQTAALALRNLQVQPQDARAALASLRPWLDMRNMRAGDAIKVYFDANNRLTELEVARGPVVQARTQRRAQGWEGERPQLVVDTVIAEVSGQVRSSLWDALVQAGEDPRLVARLVDIFAYAIDFYSELQPGDVFSLLVEKRYVNGEFIEYGAVTAAEFTAAKPAKTKHQAFLHRRADGSAAYYDAAGNSMRKQLLKAPLKYALVTSRFGVRRHPVLGYTRHHNGTDYGVPVGTPVWAVGDGRVVKAGWYGGYGRLVEIVHPNGWVSQYAHLSRLHVRRGALVSQKQVVGLVGQTGLATGPHLHYGLKHHGHYVNSLAQHFERSAPLQLEALQVFQQRVANLIAELNKLRLAQEATDAVKG